jgi:hypothetical protein
VVVNAGEVVCVVPGEPQPCPGVGLRAGRGAELGDHEVAEVLLGGAPSDVLLHRLEHPPVSCRGGRHGPPPPTEDFVFPFFFLTNQRAQTYLQDFESLTKDGTTHDACLWTGVIDVSYTI